MSRKSVMRGLTTLCAVIAFSWIFVVGNSISWAAEKEYPNRPLTFVIAFPPGGSVDLPMRVAQASLRDNLGVPIVLESKAGAGGALASDYVANAKPDGYTLLTTSSGGITIVPQTTDGIKYRHTDFIPVCSPTVDYLTLAVQSSAPYKTLDEMISYARKNPGKLNCSTAGMGTTAHLFIEAFKQNYGLDITVVHFNGGVPALNAVLGGHVDLTTATLGTMIPQIKAGKINLLAVGAPKRLKKIPDVPTLVEKGFAGALSVRNAIFLPKGSPQSTVDKLASAFEKTFNDPTIIQNIEKADLNVEFISSDATQKHVNQEYTTVAEIIRKGAKVK